MSCADIMLVFVNDALQFFITTGAARAKQIREGATHKLNFLKPPRKVLIKS